MDVDAGGGQSSWAHALHGLVRSLFAALHPCRFALLAVAVPGIALVTAPQLQECLRALAERSQIPLLKHFHWAAMFVAALCWAASAWFWPRQLLSFRFSVAHSERLAFRRAAAILPRAIGTAALALLAAAIHRAGEGYGPAATGGFVHGLDGFALLAAGLGVSFYLFVHVRRRLFGLPQAPTVSRARDLPLGWTLPDAARCEIDRQLVMSLASPLPRGSIATLDALLPRISTSVHRTSGCPPTGRPAVAPAADS